MSDMTLLCIANDGVKIYGEQKTNGKLYIWGESEFEGHIEIERLDIRRSVDKDLPQGEYPADLVTYDRVRR